MTALPLIFPEGCRSLWTDYAAGEVDLAYSRYVELSRFGHAALEGPDYPSLIKAVMHCQGVLASPEVRLPLIAADPARLAYAVRLLDGVRYLHRSLSQRVRLAGVRIDRHRPRRSRPAGRPRRARGRAARRRPLRLQRGHRQPLQPRRAGPRRLLPAESLRPDWSEMRASELLTIGLGGERLAGRGSSTRRPSRSTSARTARARTPPASCTRTCRTRPRSA